MSAEISAIIIRESGNEVRRLIPNPLSIVAQTSPKVNAFLQNIAQKTIKSAESNKNTSAPMFKIYQKLGCTVNPETHGFYQVWKYGEKTKQASPLVLEIANILAEKDGFSLTNQNQPQ